MASHIKDPDGDICDRLLESYGFVDVGDHWELDVDSDGGDVEVGTVTIDSQHLLFDGVPVIRNPSRGDLFRCMKLLHVEV